MFEIRVATELDRALLVKMYLEEINNDSERAERFAQDFIEHFKTLLALQDGQLCGTLTWDRRGGFDDGVVEIVALGVNKSFRRQGVAKRLVTYFIQETSKFYSENGYPLRVIIIFMEGENEVARKFYSNLGFTEEARILKLYPHDDGVIWTRHINH
ncbi:GNAT family N-acetyltransferase [Candidatus Thorarchaeota archaeon]|nr:MAG: GNAT family N-acetyltransferase [Candidatus Thorarchaeota archaeon]